mmetsp:Transcript_38174/g.89548  ORF Transcript_38174/g.89548 Transcript_38174/m.89548 type:complete len:120 (-) Transcript_38174:222-581(-)|eukprot:CAMPEP_0178384536 /NCGR_PEP_ID=MMETSP0689_2-20121128/7564_1 /TAXON_ID=160604 /ORGANISM="Amphidinium massartii, Strain CS-259" /LENGTH=119 /DNA_ID=CAMNT_0020004783 /DNA_START=20 /DNA_END=379 /DNA_ORIENTATION=-
MALPGQALTGVFTANDSMHLRIKRKGTTAFVLCYPEQMVIEVKQKVGMIFNRDASSFRLIYKDMVLDDNETVRAQQISLNDVVHLVFKVDGSDQYEKQEFDDLDRLHFEHEAKTKEAGG